jgi:glycosyltransferase involved in cell wall biosynthesis
MDLPNTQSLILFMESISIVITSRSTELSIRCLKSLISFFPVDSMSTEIILLYQGNKEPKFKEFANSSVIKIIYILPNSLSYSRNNGSRLAKGKYLLFLDDDIELIKTLNLKDLIKNKDIGTIQILSNLTLNPLLEPRDELKLKKILKPKDWRIFMGAALFIKKNIFIKLKGFNENLGVGSEYGSGEETDLFFKAFEKGYQIWWIESYSLIHPEVASCPEEKQRMYTIGQGYMSKLSGFFSKRFYYCLLLPISWHLVSIILPLDNRKRLFHLKMIKHLLIGLF